MNRFEKPTRYYKTFAVVLLNIIVLFGVLNLLAIAVMKIGEKSAPSNPVAQKYSYDDALKAAYTWLDKDKMDQLLRESWSRPVIYEAFTQFKERSYSGEYVNVSEEGFRLIKNQGSWPPDPKYFNIFVFGGSTTFGYGVADDQTVASYLQEEFAVQLSSDIRVYNFGRGFYYSTQERILFEQLLTSGFIPDAAIFIDGMNDWLFSPGKPAFTSRLAEVMNGGGKKPKSSWWSKLPIVKLVASLKSDEAKPPVAQEERPPVDEEKLYGSEPYLESVIERYLMNKRMIEAMAAEFAVVPIFVWQPVPTYKYDLSYHVFLTASPQGFLGHLYPRYGYRLFRRRLDEQSIGDNFLWSADIQEASKELLYVDLVHYSPDLSRRLAGTIARLVSERKLLDAALKREVRAALGS
jgi:hypothetical protein